MTHKKRITLRQDVFFEGLGLHSGAPIRLAIHPSKQGIRFRKRSQIWQAIPENVTDTSRCTRLGEVSTIEHLMSAFAGLEITDAEVELVTGSELPALDGGSLVYAQGLMDTGFEPLSDQEMQPLFKRIFVHDNDVKIAISSGEGLWCYRFFTQDRWPGEMAYESRITPENFVQNIAPSRTFGFEEELPMIEKAGLAKGLNASNALVLGQQDFLNPPLFADEPARHKLLDLMGDLYLSGVPVRSLNVVAERSGHKANVEAASRLWQIIQSSEIH